MKTRFAGFQSIRPDCHIGGHNYQPHFYTARHKLPEQLPTPQRCAIFYEGRWQWAAQPAKAEYPFERLVEAVEQDGGIQVTRTGIHRDRAIAETRYQARKGELGFHCNVEENLLRVVRERKAV